MKFDIPINFTIEATSELMAEAFINTQLDRMIVKHGLEELVEFQDFEFIAKEPRSSGCGNDHCC